MKIRALSLALAAVIATGCATHPTGRSGELVATAQTTLANHQGRVAEQTPYFVVHDRMWIGSKQIDELAEKQYPEVFNSAVIFRRSVPVTLNQVAEYVQSSYGVQVVITTDAIEAATGNVVDPVATAARQNSARLAAAASAAQLQAGPPQPGQQMQQMQPQQMGQQGQQGNPGEFFLNYEGDLKGMLDRTAAATGNSWKYERGRVTIFNLDTRAFSLSILPGSTTVSSTITNQASGGGGGEGGGASNSSQQSGGSTASMSATIDQFQSIVDSVNSMLSPRGKAVAAPGISQMTVTDVPSVLDRIEGFVKDMNEVATRQVVLQVQVYAIESDNENSTGIRWDSVWQSLRESAGLITTSVASSNSNSLGYAIVDPSSRFNGSQVVLEALSRQANLQELTSVTQATLNGQVVPIQTGQEVAYIENVQTTLVPDVGAQTTRTLGRINTGFSMTALPIITSGDEILLQLQANLSTLRELRRVGSVEEGQQEAPLTDGRQTFNRVKLKNGQTLVITGLEQEQFRTDLRGVGTPGFQLLGGGTNKSRKKTTIIIMVTPRIVE